MVPTTPDPKTLSDEALKNEIGASVNVQKAAPSEATTARVMGGVSEGSRRVHDLFSGVTEAQAGAEGLVSDAEALSAELVGSEEARRMRLEERSRYEELLRGVLSDAGTLIKEIQELCAGLKSTDVTPAGLCDRFVERLNGKTDGSSKILIGVGRDVILSLFQKSADDGRLKLDNLLDGVSALKLDVPDLSRIEKAERGGARSVLTVLMRALRGAVAGVSANALGGFGSVLTEGLGNGKAEALATLTSKIGEGSGVLVAVGGKTIYCHQSNKGLEQVQAVVQSADDPYGVIGVIVYEKEKISTLIKELPAGYELTVQNAVDGSEVTLKRNSGDGTLDKRDLKKLGVEDDKDLLNDPVRYLYGPRNFVKG